jgi:MFS family permease
MITLAMIPLVLWKLPESMDFLQTRRPPDALVKINRILARMGHAALSVIPPEADAEKTGALGVRALLVKDRIFATLMLWLAFAMSFASLYFLFSWVVTLARNSGLAMEDALLAGIAMNLGAFFGSLSLGYVSLKIGLKRTMLIFFTLAACIIIPYGFLKTSVSIILVVIFILMFFVQGSFAGLYVVAARMYPTEIRTTGIGWAIGAGRLGAIFGPSCAGFLLGAGLPISWTFVVFAIPLFLAGVTISRLKAGDFK